MFCLQISAKAPAVLHVFLSQIQYFVDFPVSPISQKLYGGTREDLRAVYNSKMFSQGSTIFYSKQRKRVSFCFVFVFVCVS